MALHWKYKVPLSPAEHTYLMRRLIKAFDAHPKFGIDIQLRNPNRVMQAVGSIHPKTGKRVSIEEEADVSYEPADFDFLPAINATVAHHRHG